MGVTEPIREAKSRKTLKESFVEAISLSSLADLIYAYGNDLRVLHLNVKGKDFKSVHEALNGLYDTIFDAYDTVAELAIARGEEVKNPSTVVSTIKPLEARTFNCEEAITIARDEGLKVLDAVCSIEGYDKAVQPALDNIIVSLDKTLNYVFARWIVALDAEDPTSELSDGEHFAYRGLFSEQARRNKIQLKESYKDFDWQVIKDYCFNLENKDTSKLRDLDDVYDFLNDYFEPLQVEFQWHDEYPDEAWKDSYIQNGVTYGNGIIIIHCDLQNILDALTGTVYRKECITSIATTVVHELMHRYQVTQFPDRKWDKMNTEDDYLAHKDEISAHVAGGVTELLGIGYTKEQLKKALTTMDTDLGKSSSPFWESNSLYVYWDRFGSFDPQDKVWLRFKKELANFVLSLD